MNGESFDLVSLHIAEPTAGAQVGYGVLVTHPGTVCAGEPCPIHNPSTHPLNGAPLNWRADRRLMERICPHGVGHPDPDDLTHKARTHPEAAWAAGVHGCDGCCHTGDTQ